VYILANRDGRVLYIGATTALTQRIAQHRARAVPSFTSRYRVTRLVYIEEYERIVDARAREEQLKGWRRAKKMALIKTVNPQFEDLMAGEP
jgi:putative endonuclease